MLIDAIYRATLFGHLGRGWNDSAQEQMGDVEVQGRHVETMLRKVIDQMSTEDYNQWLECVDVTTEAQNSLMRRGGYSAYQLVFGRDPEIPGDDILSNEANPISNSAILHDARLSPSGKASSSTVSPRVT